MDYQTLGGKQSSRIVMGCMRIADKPLQKTEALIVEAVKSGVNTFDLADIYGKGDCERVFGVAVRDIGLKRSDYIVQTKCGIRYMDKGLWFDFSKDHIINSVENSLKRMNTDYIDVLLLHRPDSLMEPEEIAEAFEKLKSEGKVRAFGVSNFSAGQMALLQNYGVEVIANQVQFSLCHTPLIDAGFNVNMYNEESISRAGDALDYCRLHKVALQAWSPLQKGFFGGVFIGDESLPTLNAELNTLAEKYGCDPAAIAFAWILRHPARFQVVTGTTSAERLAKLCKATDVYLTKEEWYGLYLSVNRKLP